MLGHSIFEDTKRDIQDHADAFTHELKQELEAETLISKAILTANRVAIRYHRTLTQTIFKRLREIGDNAVEYYASDLSKEQRDQEVVMAMDELVHNKYYGLTLPERIRHSHLQLRRNIKRSSSVGAKQDTKLLNITRVFNDTYPFGAQKHWDNRLFLAEAVRLEHVIARNIGYRKAYKLAIWTLSDKHPQEDICDRLATAVDPEVAAFIQIQKYDLNPAGVYFIDTVPNIPHPNCQCIVKYPYKTDRRKKLKPKKRLNLIQRIIRAIFKK